MCMEQSLPIFEIFPNHFYYRCNNFHPHHWFAWPSTYNDRHIAKPASDFQIEYLRRSVRRKVAMIIDDWHRFRIFMIKMLGDFVL